MPLRDFLIAPRGEGGEGKAGGPREVAAPGRVAPGGEGEAGGPREVAAPGRVAPGGVAPGGVGPGDAAPRLVTVRGRLRLPLRARERDGAAALAPSLGVLANARDLPAVAVAVGVVVARRSPAALVCVQVPGDELPAPALRAPPRRAATRLVASLRARGLVAEVRGRVAVVELAREPDHAAAAAARALAAAGALPTVLAVAARDPDLDVLLAAQDAILVALPPSADPTLAELAASGAARLAPRATSITLSLDPASRTLALAGLRAPAAVKAAVEGAIARRQLPAE
jgi:hypothetical protein